MYWSVLAVLEISCTLLDLRRFILWLKTSRKPWEKCSVLENPLLIWILLWPRVTANLYNNQTNSLSRTTFVNVVFDVFSVSAFWCTLSMILRNPSPIRGRLPEMGLSHSSTPKWRLHPPRPFDMANGSLEPLDVWDADERGINHSNWSFDIPYSNWINTPVEFLGKPDETDRDEQWEVMSEKRWNYWCGRKMKLAINKGDVRSTVVVMTSLKGLITRWPPS